jgi:prepilin-type N-terminal cleavage/methylation domain-containing protein
MIHRTTGDAWPGGAPGPSDGRIHRAGGFGLVELMVALMILSMGMVALTGVAAVAQRSFSAAQALEEGANAASLMLDSLMREPAPVAGQWQDGRASAQWSVWRDSTAMVIDLTVTVADGARDRQLTFRASHHAR